MNLRSLLLCAACAALAFGPLRVSAASTEDRLKLLEDRLAAVEKENSSLKKQLGYDAKGNATAATVMAQGKETKLAVGGYIQANAEFGDAPDARFAATDRILVRRARLGVKGTFAENVDFVLQTDFGNNSIGGVSGYRGQITDCAVTWNRFPAANVTIGQFKTPYGYEQLLADTKCFLVERSLPSDRLTLSRQIGAMVSGAALDKRITYSGGLFNGNGVNNGANDNDQFLYVGRVTGLVAQTAEARLAVGVNAFSTRDTGTFTGRRTGLGVDVQAGFGPVELQAEFFDSHLSPVAGKASDTTGWALVGTYLLVPKTLQAVVRYETYDPNDAVGGDQTDLWSVGFNYFLKGDDLKLSVNYLIGDPAGPLSGQSRLLSRFQVIF